MVRVQHGKLPIDDHFIRECHWLLIVHVLAWTGVLSDKHPNDIAIESETILFETAYFIWISNKQIMCVCVFRNVMWDKDTNQTLTLFRLYAQFPRRRSSLVGLWFLRACWSAVAIFNSRFRDWLSLWINTPTSPGRKTLHQCVITVTATLWHEFRCFAMSQSIGTWRQASVCQKLHVLLLKFLRKRSQKTTFTRATMLETDLVPTALRPDKMTSCGIRLTVSAAHRSSLVLVTFTPFCGAFWDFL